jgi:hypothetical protein
VEIFFGGVALVMQKRWVWLSVFCLFYTHASGLQAQDKTSESAQKSNKRSGLSLEQWLTQTLPMMDETVAFHSQEAAINALQLSEEQIVRQTPFSLDTNLYGQSYQKPAVGTSILEVADANGVEGQTILDANLQASPYPDKFMGLSQTLAYRNWEGVNAQVQAGVTYGNYFEGVADVPDRYNYTVNGTLAYDIIQGGSESPLNLQAYSQAMTYEAQRLSITSALAQLRVSFFRLMVDVYNAKCNVDFISPLRGKVDDAVKTGKVQLDANTISYTDYLNYLNLKTSFEQSWLQEQTYLEALLAQAGGWGLDVRQALEAKLREGISCDFNFDAGKEGEIIVGATQKVDALVMRHPDFRANQLRQDAAAANLKGLKTRQKMSFGPYVGVNYAQGYFGDNGLGDVQGGVTLAYTPPGAQGRYAIKAGQAMLQNRKLITSRDRLNASANLQRLRQQITRQIRVVQLSQENLTTSNQLIDTLETQMSLGFSNSLNYAQSYLNHIRNIASFLDSVSSLKKNINELSVYRSFAESQKPGEP